MKLYIATETEGRDSWTYLTDHTAEHHGQNYSVTYQEAKKEDVTVKQICEAICDCMESDNRHDMTDFGFFIAGHMRRADVAEEVIRDVLWNIASENGLSFRLRG